MIMLTPARQHGGRSLAISAWFVVVGLMAALGCSGSNDSATATEAGPSGTGGTGGAAFGAGGSGAVGDSAAQIGSLRLEPTHLTTGLDGALVRPSLVAWANLVNHTDRAWVAAAVTLRTSPLNGIVPTTGAFEDADAGTVGDFTYRLTPTAPLATGWYVLSVLPPSDYGVAPSAGVDGPAGPIRQADGTCESYLRVGSDPLLLSVAACASDKVDSFPKMIVWFSEPVQVPDPTPIQVMIGGAPATCTVYDPAVPGKPELGLSCDPAIPAGADVVISITAGITSIATGAPLRTVAGETRATVQLPAAQPYVSCRTWREVGVPAE